MNNSYRLFQLIEKGVHGTKVCEGRVMERLLDGPIRSSGVYDEVVRERKVDLPPDPRPRTRKYHNVDIFCKNDDEMLIFAYNSKGKSFNNTESAESLLTEYLKYKKAIETEFPHYSVIYAVLKDEYDPNDKKMTKYHFLNENGIPVYNTQARLEMRYNVNDYEHVIDMRRKEMVIHLLRNRILNLGLSKEEIISVLFAPDPDPQQLAAPDPDPQQLAAPDPAPAPDPDPDPAPAPAPEEAQECAPPTPLTQLTM